MQNVPILVPLDGYTKLIEGIYDLTPTERYYLVDRALAQYRPSAKDEPLTIDDIVDIVCEVTDVPRLRIIKPTRVREVVHARHLIVYFITLLLPTTTLKRIGAYLGGRDHTTVIHARRKVMDMLDIRDRETLRDVELINEMLKSRLKSREPESQKGDGPL